MPACCSDTLTNVLPHRNTMPQTHDRTPTPSQYTDTGADLSLRYPLMWNVTPEYTATHFNVLGKTRPGNSSPIFDTHTPANTQLYDAVMVVVSRKLDLLHIQTHDASRLDCVDTSTHLNVSLLTITRNQSPTRKTRGERSTTILPRWHILRSPGKIPVVACKSN